MCLSSSWLYLLTLGTNSKDLRFLRQKPTTKLNMADPWADDWGDDWNKPARPKQETPQQVWSRANDSPVDSVSVAQVAPGLGYKPPLKILKRETAAVVPQDPTIIHLTPVQKAQVAALEKSAREQRYKEARERLFGSSSAITTAQDSVRQSGVRPEYKLQNETHVSMPERQSRGPQVDGGRGFERQGRT